ncbi:hypothetical protein ACIBL3_34070 [Kribbella sp. NPDC050124]|uniref:hypothetical protein n=1 Tax=Kribbella sp. NPDC050124 TaxID=3364114 RepID=UPI00378FE7F3
MDISRKVASYNDQENLAATNAEAPRHLRTRLRGVLGTRAARLGTIHELARLAPVAILAEALGYSPATIERHAVDSGAAYARDVAAVRDT